MLILFQTYDALCSKKVHQSDNMIHFILPSNIKIFKYQKINWLTDMLSTIFSAIFVAIMNMCQPYSLPSWICADNQQLFLSYLLLSWICVSHICCHPEFVSAIFVAILNLCQLWLSCWIIILVSHIYCYPEQVSAIFVAIMICFSHICCHPEFLSAMYELLNNNFSQPYLLLLWICVSHICCHICVMYVSYRYKVRLRYNSITNILIIVQSSFRSRC